jgi:hypothetical protein
VLLVAVTGAATLELQAGAAQRNACFAGVLLSEFSDLACE